MNPEEGMVYFAVPKKNVTVVTFPLKDVILPLNYETTNRSEYLGIKNISISLNAGTRKPKDVYLMRCEQKTLDSLLSYATSNVCV